MMLRALALVFVLCIPMSAAPQVQGALVIPFTPAVTLRLGMTEEQVSAALKAAGVSMTTDPSIATRRIFSGAVAGAPDAVAVGSVALVAGRVSSARYLFFSKDERVRIRYLLGLLPTLGAKASCTVGTEHALTPAQAKDAVWLACPGKNPIALVVAEDGIAIQEELLNVNGDR